MNDYYYYVYAYIDPRDGVPFYIGAGHGDRDVSHLTACHTTRRFPSYFYNKLRKMAREDVAPVVWRIADGLTRERAFGAWEPWFIKTIGRRDLGTGPLCNLTDGGDGVHGYVWTEEGRAKLSQAIKTALSRPETKQRQSERMVTFWADAGRRHAASERARAFYADGDERNIQSKRMKQVLANPESRARIRDKAKQAWSQEDYRTRISAARKAAWTKPGYKQRVANRIAESWTRPDVLQSRSEGIKAALAQPEERGRRLLQLASIRSDPELEHKRLRNSRHSGPRKSRSYKGTQRTRLGKYVAKIGVDGSRIRLGTFVTELEAARAYNDAVDKWWGGDGYKNRIAERRATHLRVKRERRSGVERRCRK